MLVTSFEVAGVHVSQKGKHHGLCYGHMYSMFRGQYSAL